MLAGFGALSAEELAFDEVSTGAQNDLVKATDIARSMVKEFGMSESMGLVAFERNRQSLYLQAPQFTNAQEYSEKTSREIDAEIKKIVDIQMRYLAKRLADSKITLDLTDAAMDFLANTGFDPVYGARPLKRTIQHLIQDRLAMKILEGSVSEGDHVSVDVKDGDIVFAQ